MLLQEEIIHELKNKGADFVHFVDITQLSAEQNKGYPIAILFGILLSPKFIQKVSDKPDYVKEMLRTKKLSEDEFHNTEMKTDELADFTASFLSSKGYAAYSQSENNIESTGFYDNKNKRTPLPHKTIALMAGLGWIGKHNLLVTPNYGSAISMCTVLTDAPAKAVSHSIPTSQCGDCTICKDVCDVNAITGKLWKFGSEREHLVDVFKCTTCIRCLVLCPWTQKYVKNVD